MLSENDKAFLAYWSANRLRQKKSVRQFLLGIPIGLLFAVPIAVNFTSGWYKRAGMMERTSDFNPTVLMVALLLIVGFVAIFSKRYQWEKNEQHFRELQAKLDAEQKAQEK